MELVPAGRCFSQLNLSETQIARIGGAGVAKMGTTGDWAPATACRPAPAAAITPDLSELTQQTLWNGAPKVLSSVNATGTRVLCGLRIRA